MPAKTPPRGPTNPPAPDPSDTYERSHPEHEAGMGRLDSDEPVPSEFPDAIEQTVEHRQDGSRQINAHETENQQRHEKPAPGH
jgi:hypothetical protein